MKKTLLLISFLTTVLVVIATETPFEVGLRIHNVDLDMYDDGGFMLHSDEYEYCEQWECLKYDSYFFCRVGTPDKLEVVLLEWNKTTKYASEIWIDAGIDKLSNLLTCLEDRHSYRSVVCI